MSDRLNPLRKHFFIVLQIVTPFVLIVWLFYRSHVDRLPGFTIQDSLTISLAAMQVTLAALAICIGIAAIVGFQAIQHAAKSRAAEVAEEIARDAAKSAASTAVGDYLSTNLPREILDEIDSNLSKKSEERPKKGIKKRKEEYVEGRAVSE